MYSPKSWLITFMRNIPLSHWTAVHACMLHLMILHTVICNAIMSAFLPSLSSTIRSDAKDKTCFTLHGTLSIPCRTVHCIQNNYMYFSALNGQHSHELEIHVVNEKRISYFTLCTTKLYLSTHCMYDKSNVCMVMQHLTRCQQRAVCRLKKKGPILKFECFLQALQKLLWAPTSQGSLELHSGVPPKMRQNLALNVGQCRIHLMPKHIP